METVERSQTEDIQNVREYLRNTIEKNPAGGEIVLDDLVRQTGAPRGECVRAMKKSNLGHFMSGRRGKKTRLVYGPQAMGTVTRQDKPKNTSRKISAFSLQGASVELLIKVGDQVTSLAKIPVARLLEFGLAA